MKQNSELSGFARWPGIFGCIILLSLGAGAAKAQTARVPVVFSLCTGLSSTEIVDFTSEINTFASVSEVSVVLSCGTMTTLASSEQMLSVSLVKDDDTLFLVVQPALMSEDAAGTNDWHTERSRRAITWTDTTKGFVETTIASGKVKTLALLLDNMVLDFAGFRLLPDTAAHGGDAPAQMSATPVPMIRDSSEMGETSTSDESRSVTDDSAVRSVTCDCKSQCKKIVDHLKLSQAPLDATRCAERFPSLKGPAVDRYTIVGAAGGFDFFTGGSYAPSVMADVTLARNRVGVVMRLGMEGDSAFAVSGRPFRTRAGVLELGPGWIADKHRVGGSLQLLLVFRYWEVYRSDMAGAHSRLFVDFGPGLHWLMWVKFSTHFGVYLKTGVQLFPAARQIIIEDGPRKRIGRFHFPVNLGFFTRF